SSRRRHTRCLSDWSSDVCSSDLCLSEVALNITTMCRTRWLKAFIEAGADVNTADPLGFTMLVRAVSLRKYDSVVLLLDAGANVRSEERRVGSDCGDRGCERS